MGREKIVFHYLENERRYVLISSGKPVEQIVDEFIELHGKDFPLLNEDDYNLMWSHRTEINGLKTDIADARKQTTAVVINPLKNACVPLEKKLEEVSNKLTEKMLAFKPKEEKEIETTIITISCPYGSEQEDKIISYLKRNKITYKEEHK